MGVSIIKLLVPTSLEDYMLVGSILEGISKSAKQLK